MKETYIITCKKCSTVIETYFPKGTYNFSGNCSRCGEKLYFENKKRKIVFGVDDIAVGDIIEDSKGKQYLVGDINVSGGECDCCSGFDYRSEVFVIGNVNDGRYSLDLGKAEVINFTQDEIVKP